MKPRLTLTLVTLLVFQLVAYAQTDRARPSKWAQKVSTTKLKNLYRVNDTIYRSEQPSRSDFRLLDSLKIRSILNLRANYSDAQKVGAFLFVIFDVPMEADAFDDAEIIAALRVLRNSPKPIIVHCMKGSDRTGVVLAMYRVIFQNWSREKAILEMVEGGYGFHQGYTNIPAYIRSVDVNMIRNEVLK
jgi:tyrosine-protein phosphatase SIW14